MVFSDGYIIELNRQENKIEIHFPPPMTVTNTNYSTYSTGIINKLNENDLSVILSFVKEFMKTKGCSYKMSNTNAQMFSSEFSYDK